GATKLELGCEARMDFFTLTSSTNWALLGVEACAVECEKPFGISRNHLLLGKMGKIVATNIGQALKELTMVSSSTKHGRN
ncbi:hypothetical protein THAOC_13699, partial [Thalassiosira oceanica]